MKILPILKTMSCAGIVSLLASCAAMKNTDQDINTIAKKQAKMDSLAYRTLFNNTFLANDSTAVADFNKIAAVMRNITKTTRRELSKEILGNAQEYGITNDQKNIINGVQYISSPLVIELKQKLADRFVYEKFFEEHGLSDKLAK